MNRYERRHGTFRRSRFGLALRRTAGHAAGLIAGAALAGLLLPGPAWSQGTIDNPVAVPDITVDGQFTGAVFVPDLAHPGRQKFGTASEWSNITPAGFLSQEPANGPLTPLDQFDPRVNSLLYAAVDSGADNLYLMYDYLPRTQPFAVGDTAAQVTFPFDPPTQVAAGINTCQPFGPDRRTITVIFKQGTSAFDVLVQSPDTGHGALNEAGSCLGLTGAVGF